MFPRIILLFCILFKVFSSFGANEKNISKNFDVKTHIKTLHEFLVKFENIKKNLLEEKYSKFLLLHSENLIPFLNDYRSSKESMSILLKLNLPKNLYNKIGKEYKTPKKLEKNSINGKDFKIINKEILNNIEKLEIVVDKIGQIKQNLVNPRHRYFPHFFQYTSILIPLLKDFISSKNSCRILAKLRISKKLKKEILILEDAPIETKAYLGDQKSLKLLLKKFHHAKGKNKSYYINDLMYVGIDKFPLDFKNMMESKEFFIGVYQRKKTIVFSLIYSYGLFHLDTLFQPERFKIHLFINEKDFKKNEHQKYIKKIELFFQNKYGIFLKIKAPFLIKGKKYIEH